MAESPLVLVPHKILHDTVSIFAQSPKLAANVVRDGGNQNKTDLPSIPVPMSTARLQRILRFRMGSHLLPIEQGRHLRLPRHRRMCRLYLTGALADERHMLLVGPAHLQLQISGTSFLYWLQSAQV